MEGMGDMLQVLCNILMHSCFSFYFLGTSSTEHSGQNELIIVEAGWWIHRVVVSLVPHPRCQAHLKHALIKKRKQQLREMISSLGQAVLSSQEPPDGSWTAAGKTWSSNWFSKETLFLVFSWNLKNTLKDYFNMIWPRRAQRWQEHKTVEKASDI